MNSPQPGSDRAAPTLPKRRNAQIRFYCQLLESRRRQKLLPVEVYEALKTLRTARWRIRCYRASCLNDLPIAAAIKSAHVFLGFNTEL